jgi:ketosteroid isomerase-like protein
MDRRASAEALLRALADRDLEVLGELTHPDLDFRSVLSTAEGEVYRGVDGVRRWAHNVDETWDDFRLELAEFREVGEDQAVVVVRLTGRAKASGVPLDALVGQVWTWREGKPWRNVAYSDAREAYAAVGLEP